MATPLKATPTLAAAYSIFRAVKIPVMCSSGLSAVTAPMAIAAGTAGVGVGSAVNKLNCNDCRSEEYFLFIRSIVVW